MEHGWDAGHWLPLSTACGQAQFSVSAHALGSPLSPWSAAVSDQGQWGLAAGLQVCVVLCALTRCVPTAHSCEQEHCPPDAFLTLSGQLCRPQLYVNRYQRDLCHTHCMTLACRTSQCFPPSIQSPSWDLFLRPFTSPCQHPSSPASVTITFASGPCSGLSICDNGSCSWKTLPLGHLSHAPMHG